MSDRNDEQKWKVEFWMTAPVLSVGPRVVLQTAFLKMQIGGFRHLPVVEKGQLIGIVSDRDLRRPDVGEEVEDWRDLYQLDSQLLVGDLMTLNPHTVKPGDCLERAVELIKQYKYGALPVVDDEGVLLGIVTTHDCTRALDEALATIRTIAAQPA